MKRSLFTVLIAAFVLSGAAMAQGGATDQYGQPDSLETISFEVDTEGQVPEGTMFFSFPGYVGEPFSPIQLTDPDGDGVPTPQAGSWRGAQKSGSR